MMFSSCDYDYIHPEPIVLPADSVSFTADIIPIFNKGCNMSGCHSSGTFFDLSPANAYQTLKSKNQIITDSNYAKSPLYLKITTGSMKDYNISLTDKALILKWIKEGANNN
jgi:hypothetical protein